MNSLNLVHEPPLVQNLVGVLAEFKKEAGKDYNVEDLLAVPELENLYGLPNEEENPNQPEEEMPEDPYGPRIIFYYHPDYLGNVEYITDMDGKPYQYFWYSPWGESLKDQKAPSYDWSSPYRFNGKELDEESGLYYYGARYYNPQVSVWLSVDPLANMYPHLTPYNFVENNPIMLIDPTGMGSEDPEGGGFKLSNLFNKVADWFKPEQEDNDGYFVNPDGSKARDELNTVTVEAKGVQKKSSSGSPGPSESTQSSQASSSTSTPTMTFEAGKAYSLNLDAVEVINVAGTSFGWWEAQYGSHKAESDPGVAIGVAGELGMFSRYSVKEITFKQTMSGNSLAEVLNQTGKIELITAGAIIHGVKMKGYTLNSELQWESEIYKGGGWSGGPIPSGSFQVVKFKDK